MRKLLSVFLMFFTCLISAHGQYSTLNANSHADYAQITPFYPAYYAHYGSIEADVWADKGVLYTAHDSSGINTSKTFESLYIQPVTKEFRKNGGKVWSDISATLQLIINLRSVVEPTLSQLVEAFKKYPDVFDSNANSNAIQIVITGNIPSPSDFKKYPLWISFDGNVTLKYNAQQLKRVALYSQDMADLTGWKGRTPLSEIDENKLKQIIGTVHGLNKKIRFRNAPDTAYAWRTLMKLKVDYLNTDHTQDLATYLENFKPSIK